MDNTTPKILGSRDGNAGFLGSIGVRFMIDGSESGGGFSLVEHPMSPRALGAPLHRHAREDEYSYVIEGGPSGSTSIAGPTLRIRGEPAKHPRAARAFSFTHRGAHLLTAVQ